jgi:hypothetical protein
MHMQAVATSGGVAPLESSSLDMGGSREALGHSNNYSRPSGQNVGWVPPAAPPCCHANCCAVRGPQKGAAADSNSLSPTPAYLPRCPACSNFMTDKPSSRVLAPPGGGSSIVFG